MAVCRDPACLLHGTRQEWPRLPGLVRSVDLLGCQQWQALSMCIVTADASAHRACLSRCQSRSADLAAAHHVDEGALHHPCCAEGRLQCPGKAQVPQLGSPLVRLPLPSARCCRSCTFEQVNLLQNMKDSVPPAWLAACEAAPPLASCCRSCTCSAGQLIAEYGMTQFPQLGSPLVRLPLRQQNVATPGLCPACEYKYAGLAEAVMQRYQPGPRHPAWLAACEAVPL